MGCSNGKGTPDVSDIKIDLQTERYDLAFFGMDTSDLRNAIPELDRKEPYFTKMMLRDILNMDPRWPIDSMATYTKEFIRTHYPVYDSAEKVFKNFAPYQLELKNAFRYVKYYFHEYKLPKKIITYVGPLDGYGDIITDSALVIGLQHHLGAGFSGYRAVWMQETYPSYLTQNFVPQTIAVNAMKIILDDIFPPTSSDKPLLDQMVENGKRLYILQLLLPEKDVHYLIGYTEKQMKECVGHEKQIWDMFVQNNYLQQIEPALIRRYIGESPKTQELGEAAPGNIGSFAGWQIVKKWMQKNKEVSPKKLMETPAETIYKEAKYKP